MTITTIEELQVLLENQHGESEKLEFKKSTSGLKGAAETLCAFLNSSGGLVLIGVVGQGKVLGQDVTDQTQQEIANTLQKFEPTPNIQIHYIDVDAGKKVIVMKAVPVKEFLPYTFAGRAYERYQSSTVQMPREKYQQLIFESLQHNQHWETLPSHHVTLDDLDEETLIETVNKGIREKRIKPSVARSSIDEMLRKLKLIDKDQILNAAVVIYGKDMLPHYPQCVLRLARFRGVDKKEFLDNRQIHGHVFKLLDEAVDFIDKHLPVAGRIVPGKMMRVDEPMFPYEAVREALVNAFCHRNYTVRGGAVSIAIYDNRMEIWSEGGLPFGQQIDDLKKEHISKPRNTLIASVFYRLGLIESWGRGTQDIIDECLDAGLPEPEFLNQGNTFCVRFIPKVPIGPVKVAVSELTKRQQEILRLITSHGELPLRTVVEMLENPPPPATVYNDLAHLKTHGYLETRGHGRGASWYVVKGRVK